MAYMRFIIAPDWFIKLPNEHLLTSKAVLDLYNYSLTSCNSQTHTLVRKGLLPPPDKVTVRPVRNKWMWSVGYLKNYLKLPTELIEVKKTDMEN